MILKSGAPGGGQVVHMGHMQEAERRRRHGSGDLKVAASVVAGERVQVRFVFEIGEEGLARGGALRAVWRWPFDWGDVQSDDPGGEGYARIESEAAAELRLTYARTGDLNPWLHQLEIKVESGRLQRGDRVEVHCENWPSPTFACRRADFLLLASASGGPEWVELVGEQRFSIEAGRAEELVVLSVGEAVVGEWVEVKVRAEDRWGNVAPLETRPLVEGGAADIEAAGAAEAFPVYLFRARWQGPGVHRLRARAGRLEAESHPVRVHAESPLRRLFWGDLHAGQSEVGCGVGTLEEHFAHARDVAFLQFASQQANDHYITLALWDHIRELSHAFDEKGRFACFLGCEWSPLTVDGGDRNVVYRDDEQRLRRSGRFFEEDEPDPEPDLPRAPEFLAALRAEEVLLNLHVGGRPTNLDFHEPAIEPLFEIHSTHATSEWFVEEALERGYRVGITGGTDGVMGRPGTCRPGRRVTRNVRAGLTGVYARDLSREALWEAFRARRCYATSGERILLRVRVQGSEMGGECRVGGAPCAQVEVEGTAAIERVDLLRGTRVVDCWRAERPASRDLRVLFGGARQRGTAADQRVVWDGALGVEGGCLSQLRPLGVQGAADCFWQEGDDRVVWRAATAGNDMGFTCRIEGDGQVRCHFGTAPCTFSFDAAEAQRAPRVVEAGGLGRYVEVGPAPSAGGARSLALSLCDSAPPEGAHDYWVRVVQVDRARAWSSPIRVTIRP